MHKTFIIGSVFNVPLHPKTAFLGPLILIIIASNENLPFGSIEFHQKKRKKKGGGGGGTIRPFNITGENKSV